MVETTENNGPLIMMIDDSFMDLFINKKVLTSFSESSSIIEFNLGTKALEYLVYHENASYNIPDIIFLDIYMPCMTGFEFLQEYRLLPASTRSKISLFMLSSSLDPDDLRKANEDKNITRFLQKPLTSKAVEEVASLTKLETRY